MPRMGVRSLRTWEIGNSRAEIEWVPRPKAPKRRSLSIYLSLVEHPHRTAVQWVYSSALQASASVPFQLLKAIRRFCNLCERFPFITYSDYDRQGTVRSPWVDSRLAHVTGDWLVLPRSLRSSAFQLASSLCFWISNSVDLSFLCSAFAFLRRLHRFSSCANRKKTWELNRPDVHGSQELRFEKEDQVLVGAMLSDS